MPGLEHRNTSVTPEEAEKDGQPTAIKSIFIHGVRVRFRVVTKPVESWGRYKYNYFFAYMRIAGLVELEPNVPWSKSPREAMESALQWWLDEARQKMPYANDLFPDRIHGVEVNGGRGYWLIDGTHTPLEET